MPKYTIIKTVYKNACPHFISQLTTIDDKNIKSKPKISKKECRKNAAKRWIEKYYTPNENIIILNLNYFCCEAIDYIKINYPNVYLVGFYSVGDYERKEDLNEFYVCEESKINTWLSMYIAEKYSKYFNGTVIILTQKSFGESVVEYLKEQGHENIVHYSYYKDISNILEL